MLMAPFDRSKTNYLPPRNPLNPMPLPNLGPDPSVADQAAFTVLDGNGDGTISKDEWTRAGWSADRFKSFDANGDGKIDQQEFLQARRYEREFQEKDANHDGSLDSKEFNKSSWFGSLGNAAAGIFRCFPIPGLNDNGRFKKFDKNGDGKISEAEYIAGRRAEDSQPIAVPVGPIQPVKPKQPIWYA